MDSFIQITLFCPHEPRVGVFVHRNAGKVLFQQLCKFYSQSFGLFLELNHSQVGHSKFQVTGMTEGSYGFEIFYYGIIWGTKIW